MDNGQTYSIGELAELAGVTPRTIRYYTSEGLLPPPDTQGKYARYNHDHLERLQLIAQLKSAYLPLHKIRARIERLDSAGVHAMLNELPPQQIAETRSAADYIAAVMTQQQMPQPNMPIAAPTMQAQPAAAPAVSTQRTGFFRRVAPVPRAEISAEPSVEAPSELMAQAWERITLAPGVELHIRQPQDATIQEQVRKLVAQARALFGKDS